MQNTDHTLLTSKKFQVVRREQKSADGSVLHKDIILHPGAVVIMPWIDEEHLCLIRNVRLAVGETLLELPAGTRERHEPAEETAKRELLEETGYRCQSIKLLNEFYASPGIINERMFLYSATGLTPGEQQLEQDEQIQTLITRWSDAVQMAMDGTIRDGKTLVGILLCEQLRRSGKWNSA